MQLCQLFITRGIVAHMTPGVLCGMPVCISRMWNWLSDHSAPRTGEATDVSACAIHTARSSRPCAGASCPPLASARSSSLPP